MKKNIKKRIPVKGNLYSREGKMAANDSLYGYYQSISTTDGNLTFVYEELIPSYTEIANLLGNINRKKVSRDNDYLLQLGLIEKGEIKDIHGEVKKVIILPQVEEIYQLIPLETLIYLVHTGARDTIRIYTYLLNKNKMIKNYTFTIKSLLEMLGYKSLRHTRDYERIKNILNNLKNNGLIEIEKTYIQCKDSKINTIQCYRLNNINLHYKKVI